MIRAKPLIKLFFNRKNKIVISNIVVIDDDEFMRGLIKTLLIKAGHEVIIAKDGLVPLVPKKRSRYIKIKDRDKSQEE